MYPIIFKFGNTGISSYSLMLLVAFMTAYIISGYEFKRRGLKDELRDYILLAGVIGGVVGAKILFIMENATLQEFLANPMRYFASGLTFLGGFIAALVGFWIVTKITKVSFWSYADAVSPIVMLSYAIAKVGCFLVGDDYGPPTDLPWGMAFPIGSPPTIESVHPTQLYEIGLSLMIFAFLWSIRKKNKPVGWLSAILLIMIGAERFFIEFWRVTTPSFIEGISVAQLMSVGCLVAGTLMLVNIKMKEQLSEQ